MSIKNALTISAALSFALLANSYALADPTQDKLVAAQPKQVREALDRIPDNGRKLLALRSYLRSARGLETRWSWTQAQIDAYAKTDQYATAMAAVAAVTRAFEVKNPGHTLRVNTDVRSLDDQISKWNDNASVKSSADALGEAATKWLTDNPKGGPDDFRAFLTGWSGGTVMLAAPGLSLHGRGMAFDFQVVKDGAVLAGASSGAAWRGATPGPGGWDARLREAVRLSTMPFDGPLDSPDEPWHYDYKPPTPVVLVVEEPKTKPDDKQTETAVAAAEPGEEPKATEPQSGPATAMVPVPVPVPTARPASEADIATAKADLPKPEQTRPEGASDTPAKSDEAKSDEAKSDEAKTETAKAGNPTSDVAKPKAVESTPRKREAKSSTGTRHASVANPERKKATRQTVKKKKPTRRSSAQKRRKASPSIIQRIFR